MLFLLILLLIPGLACQQGNVPPYADVEPDLDGTGTIFIWAVALKDEEQAMSLLSTEAQAAVVQYCDNGEVIECFNQTGLQSWGSLEYIGFHPDYSSGSTAVYGVTWNTDQSIWIVLEIIDENGLWKIDGWRGLVPTSPDGQIPSGLFDGSDTTNLFPPEE
jgi:hypothetical protein